MSVTKDRRKLEESIFDVLLDHYVIRMNWNNSIEYCYCECGEKVKRGEFDRHMSAKIADRLMEEQ